MSLLPSGLEPMLVAAILLVGALAAGTKGTAAPRSAAAPPRKEAAAPKKEAAAPKRTPAAPKAATGPVFPFTVRETTLDNGFRVMVVPYQSPGLVAWWTIVRAGSRDEIEPGRSGFAHFFEHMMFRGTEAYSRERYNDVLKGLGAEHNAFTSDDLTAYHVLAPSSAIETLMTIESDRFRNLKYPVEDFRKEAGAVLGEYNKNATNPFRALQEKLRDTAFRKHPYKHTTMGFLADIKEMPNQYDYSRTFFDRFYRPEHCTLLLVGDVDPDRVFAQALQHYGGWARGSYVTKTPVEPKQSESKRVEVAWPTATQTYLEAGYRMPAFSTTAPDLPALDLVAELLFSESAPLYQRLVVDDQWVDVLGGGPEDHRDPYLFTWAARLKKDADAARVEKEITAALEGLTKELVPAARLAPIRQHLRYALAQRLDTPSGTAEVLARYLALTGDPGSINRLYAQYESITPEQIRDVARRTFTAASRTFVTLRRKDADGAQ
ncbi:MAG TPA: pitrilysin family protein [Candidatus Polarisedimenticolia bacterium]|nr:pitrilysin family protein [Candidatus Polarisedimenticolia bacterium]